MARLGPQARKLFDVSGRNPERKPQATKKYTFILPADLMRKVKHTAIEEDTTISDWIAEAIRLRLSEK